MSVVISRVPRRCSKTNLTQSIFQFLKLALFDYQMAVIVQVFHDIVVVLFVVLEDDGFDGRVAFHENTCVDWVRWNFV